MSNSVYGDVQKLNEESSFRIHYIIIPLPFQDLMYKFLKAQSFQIKIHSPVEQDPLF